MPEFKTVARVGDIPEGEGRAYEVGGRMVAVFLVNGEYSAILDACPHMGASLASGYVESGGGLLPLARLEILRQIGHLARQPQIEDPAALL